MRPKILWFGPRLPDKEEAEFRNRKLVLELLSDLNIKELADARAVVLHFTPEKAATFKKHLLNIKTVSSDFGLLIYCFVKSDAFQDGMQQIFNQLSWFPDKNRIDPPAHEIAEAIARHNPGPRPNLSIEIAPSRLAKQLDKTKLLFFQRAFHDCKKIELSPLYGGKTATVYQINAVFEHLSDPKPMPFFAKLGKGEKIKREYEQHNIYVKQFISFRLRPNLDVGRCIFSQDLGILVGDFVEDSKPLRSVIRERSATLVINSLFQTTLKKWRSNEKRDKNIAWAVLDVFDHRKISLDRFELAKKYGATKSPEELFNILKALPPFYYAKGTVHGDLNDQNIRVLGSDAILIDFGSTAPNSALARDPAVLEVSIAFECHKDHLKDGGWLKVVESLYSLKSLRVAPSVPSRLGEKWSWLWTSVREIRIHAFEKIKSKFEYPIMIAFFLLRQSTYDEQSEHDGFRRAWAYVLAERIILDVEREMKRE